MQTINEKSHYASLISTLKKEYNNAKIGKVMNPNDIYLLDIVYNLLYSFIIPLTEVEKKKLLVLYKNILYKSKNICNTDISDKYQISKKDNTIQAEKTDCNNIPVNQTVYYWQESLISKTQANILTDITNMSYFVSKSKSSVSSFETGFTITYTSIGRISFYFPNSTLLNYEIRDVDNLVITNSFDIALETDTKGVLITSKNIYSYGQIFFKIKKS